MSGRGRGGRGGSAGTSFNREQLNAIGFAPGENLPGPITEPPPLFPILNRKPAPLLETLELDYLLILRQNFLDIMQSSGAYLHMSQEKVTDKAGQEINKLLAQLTSMKFEKFDWKLFPAELRPKVIAKRMKERNATKVVDVEQRLKQLEQIESKTDVTDVSTVDKTKLENEEDEEMQENYEDEDIDDGTDYANNYFDNGEAYEDEDDNLDDGPIY